MHKKPGAESPQSPASRLIARGAASQDAEAHSLLHAESFSYTPIFHTRRLGKSWLSFRLMQDWIERERRRRQDGQAAIRAAISQAFPLPSH